MARPSRRPPPLDYGRPGRDATKPPREPWDGSERVRGDRGKPAGYRRRRGCYLWFMILYLVVGTALALAGGWYVFSGGLVKMLEGR